ncbi:MAG TPA: alpha/beta fold hydrolase [Candidatus Binatia bacterium]|nr:alpha/beta fold hydrolase [Candidatus Binatia bacterium]
MGIRIIALLGGVLLAGAGGSDTTGDTLRSVAATYYASAGQVATITGRDSTMDYYQRLLDDAALLEESPPSYYPAPLWQQSVHAASLLDLSLALQLLQNAYSPMESIRGLGETFVKSSKDGTMQPLAVYVPTGYVAGTPAPLLVFLHGWQQAESHLLAPPYVQDLAESTGTIVVAPYGHGYYDYNGSSGDVYDAFDAACRAFTIDKNRRYIAGYSMGGFSVFNIAPMHPNDWSAVLSIAGALLNSRAPHLLATMPRARFYVVTGAFDDIVPTAFPTATAIYLRDAGVPVTFYSAPDGTHALYTLRAQLARAWDEMERGVVRTPAGLTGAADLPEAVTK